MADQDQKRYTFNGDVILMPANLSWEEVRDQIAEFRNPSIKDATFTPTQDGGAFTVPTGTKG